MRRAGVVMLALLMVLAGCPTDGGGERTVTPAPVPDLPTEAPTVGPGAEFSSDCDVPRPPSPPAAVPAPPERPVAVPIDDGTVNATALVAFHEETLSQYRYRLSTPSTTIVATENQTAFRATVGTDMQSVSHYAINGTRYTYYFEDGGRSRFGVARYRPDESTTVFGGFLSLTGGATINRALRTYPHDVDRVRSDGWTVLRAEVTEPTVHGSREINYLNSTVLVDRRGIVRSVDTRLISEPIGQDDERRTNNVSVRIGAIGRATFDRPGWVCDAAERQLSARETSNGSSAGTEREAVTPGAERGPPA